VAISTRLSHVNTCLISSTSTTIETTLVVESAVTTLPLRCSYRRLGFLSSVFAIEISFGVFHGVRRIFQSEHSIVVKKIGDLVCGFTPRILVLPVSRQVLDHSLSNVDLKKFQKTGTSLNFLQIDKPIVAIFASTS
jgi:hypothetical protein